MKKVVYVMLLSMMISMPVMADFTHGDGYSGGSAAYERVSGYFTGNGGEFTIYDTDNTNLLLSNSAYALSASGIYGGSESFQTFCLEADEYIANPMTIYVSTASVSGGDGTHAWGGGVNTDSGDDLNPLTAWVYTRFATGNLTGYAYAGTVNGLTRSQTAGSLQRLIWSVEEEGGSDFSQDFQSISLNSTQRELIDSWLDMYKESGWSGLGDVRVLQNSNFDGGAAQDLLYLMPVPVPGAILLGMLGLAVAGVKLRKYA